jgi:hypothetical protein
LIGIFWCERIEGVSMLQPARVARSPCFSWREPFEVFGLAFGARPFLLAIRGRSAKFP